MALSKSQIVEVDDIEIHKVGVPEWGGDVYVKTINAAQRDHFESSINDGETKDLVNMRARLVVLCLCDESGGLLFDDPAAGAVSLGQKSADVVDRLFDVARKLNGMTTEDVKELEGN